MATLEQGPATGSTAAETKAEVFKRLAGTRLMNVLDKMDTLANCSNRAQYEYTPEQVEKIKTAIETKLAFVLAQFAPKDANGSKRVGRVYEL
jgi:hypothetical protein